MGGILILSASVGAGHVRAAEALERAFQQADCGLPVRHVETLAYTNAVFRRLYSQAYVNIVNHVPELFGWFYDQRDRSGNDRLKHAFERLNARRFTRLLRQHQPDLTVCTHPMPAEIVSWLCRRDRLETQQSVVITDWDLHVQWLMPTPVHYFVALEETRIHMEALGVPRERISVTGIPVDPVFAEPKDKHAMRAKHGLKQDAAVILISAGGFGMGPIESLIRALLPLRGPAQIVAICGRNEELCTGLRTLATQLGPASPVSLHVVGYTTEMDGYMAAADLVVGKPGGLTMSEALARGVPFVIVHPIPGQEERNADHLLEEGAAIRCNNLPALAYKIDRLLGDPQRLASMRANILRLARPRAAHDIVQTLLAQLRSPTGDKRELQALTVDTR
jgi:processive 1,2-diacylglycerol beta-glucosyltransferase